MDLFTLHGEVSQSQPEIRTQCFEILQAEWPRSEALRWRTLDGSRESLPMSLALASPEPAHPMSSLSVPLPPTPGAPYYVVYGSARLALIPSDPQSSVWVESVVVRPGLRGRGLGQYLMLGLEGFCRARGYRRMYLCTIDQQVFYSKLGYSFCPPITYYGGLLDITQLPTSTHHHRNHPSPKSRAQTPPHQAEPSDALTSTASETPEPTPPPPPPPPPASPITPINTVAQNCGVGQPNDSPARQ
ncbi:hypothetical protein TCAL_00291 [Tigriopus californicus]|uniref:N-acetyltransferase domain-containing protein n=2 Tax=Tigriopus californicus TaxID=6832 RepID=A0A553P3Y0_TIGCA|nr:hypothetical protein TCAL_00291 [Tigriopus californicus]|eukprot:TCALIF_00291-PA protein Name:"Similar to Nat6 N-acetyltransferase 6 (Mus musculus)" AED:0.07 eAED:0.12 QI:0/-1/0/1/-1/1/1/0/243